MNETKLLRLDASDAFGLSCSENREWGFCLSCCAGICSWKNWF